MRFGQQRLRNLPDLQVEELLEHFLGGLNRLRLAASHGWGGGKLHGDHGKQRTGTIAEARHGELLFA